jgi:hypothetical protein
MAHREFVDKEGRTWEVWEVHPTIAADGRDPSRVPAIAPSLRNGWLAFRSANERRRIVPVPTSWDRLGEDDLRLLLKQAAVVSEARRLIE